VRCRRSGKLVSTMSIYVDGIISNCHKGMAVRGLTGRSGPPDTRHTPCRDSKPDSKSARYPLRGGLDLILVHDAVTVAVQVAEVIRTWGKVVLTSVHRLIVVQRWQ